MRVCYEWKWMNIKNKRINKQWYFGKKKDIQYKNGIFKYNNNKNLEMGKAYVMYLDIVLECF